MESIIFTSLKNSISYEEYHKLFSKYVAEGKTSGQFQNEDLIHYTKLNWSRSARISKKLELENVIQDKIKLISKPLVFLIITEMWCGDAAQVVPVIGKIAQQNPLVETRVVFRNENPDLMANFLTNGAKSIPKIIIIESDSHTVLANWGPRPTAVQQMVLDYKKMTEKPPFTEFVTAVQSWYNKDKGLAIQKEFIESIDKVFK